MNAKQIRIILPVAVIVGACRMAIGQELHPPAPPPGSLREKAVQKVAAMTNRAEVAGESQRPCFIAIREGGAVTPAQWLTLHKRTLDFVRSALRDLPAAELQWIEPGLEGETQERGCGEPRPFSIAGVVKHIGDAERYWLREVRIEPEFEPPAADEPNVEVFLAVLDRIEEQYRKILAERPNDQNILFGLSRACQHNLYHGGQAAHLRALQEPDWKSPGAYDVGSWERAVDYQTDLLTGPRP